MNQGSCLGGESQMPRTLCCHRCGQYRSEGEQHACPCVPEVGRAVSRAAIVLAILGWLLAVAAFVALFAPPAPAQAFEVANTSSHRQERWVIVPTPFAPKAPPAAFVGPGWLALRGRQLAEHTQLWYVRADVPGHQAVECTKWAPLPDGSAMPAFHLSPWITDDLAKMTPVVTITTAGGALVLAPASVQLIEDHPAVRTWLLQVHRGGWHVRLWAKTWSGQDAVDVRGLVSWSDTTTPAWLLEQATVELAFGERFQPYFSKRNGTQQRGAGTWTLWTGKVPFGFAIPFRGVVLPGPDAGANESTGVEEHRLELLAAAAEGPLVAACRWPAGTWLAFGAVPSRDWRTDPAAFREFLSSAGSLMDVRPLANLGLVGSTGSQPPFGALKDAAAVTGDAWRVWELLYSADDYLLRCRHYAENGGAPITRATHPQWETWQGEPEVRLAQDILGKSRTPPAGWDVVGPRTGAVDDQHRGDGYVLATYALTGDEALADDILDSVAVDEARAFRWRGWLDAPRASGRLWQSWARMAVLVPAGPVRNRIRAMAVDELDARLRLRPAGQVTPEAVVRDDRLLLGMDSWVPWNDSLAALGALEQAAAWRRLGDLALARRFESYAAAVGRNVFRWGVVEAAGGGLVPGVAVRYLAAGEPNPPAYYTFPRAGASFGGGAGVDLQVGTPGWFEWMAGAAAAVWDDPDELVRRRARQAWGTVFPAGNQLSAEWEAVR